MRKLLRSIARALLANQGVRHVNRVLSALWVKVIAAEHSRRAKIRRKYARRYQRGYARYLLRLRLRRVLHAITTPFHALWDAARSLYWRVMQPA